MKTETEQKGAHTAGPWVVELDGTCSGTWPFIRQKDSDPDDYPIAELPTTHVIKAKHAMAAATFREKPNYFKKTQEHDEVMANARLIASSPELFALAVRLKEWDKKWPKYSDLSGQSEKEMNAICIDAAALVSKATGEAAS